MQLLAILSPYKKFWFSNNMLLIFPKSSMQENLLLFTEHVTDLISYLLNKKKNKQKK